MQEWNGVPLGQYPFLVTLWYQRFYKRMNGECHVCHHKLPSPNEYKEKMRVEVKPLEAMMKKLSVVDGRET